MSKIKPLSDKEYLVIAIDPGLKNLALSIFLTKSFEPNDLNKLQAFDINYYLKLYLQKYKRTFEFSVITFFSSILEFQNTKQLYKLFRNFLFELVRSYLPVYNGRKYIYSVIAIERFVYYGRRSIRHLETFNKVIGQLEAYSYMLFQLLAKDYNKLQEPKVYEVTYTQWYHTLAPIASTFCEQRQLKRLICKRIKAKTSKKQLKDESLFLSLYETYDKELESENLAYAFKTIGDHTFDTYLLNAFSVYKEL